MPARLGKTERATLRGNRKRLTADLQPLTQTADRPARDSDPRRPIPLAIGWRR